MSVRVVARIRPLLEKEHDKDVIVRADRVAEGMPLTLVKIPSPKNESDEFSFAFNRVYDQSATQEDIFTAEVAPHIKSLFQGLDVTIFAYGVTGTGKTHTMRGGLKLADRGVIPRLLSNVFRRAKKIMRDTEGATTVDVALSYYEIYNDKVYDLLEPPEKRTPTGLPLREKDGKTIVVGLSERRCDDLKDFERLYIEANNNRVTAATKLNAHSSRSHAILRVKVTQTTGDAVRESTASAIDLAGSEDNRRTDNGKERLIESAAINKSLFVLSQCIDAISRGDKRIPYRESKMTRILSLGQNNGITIMILNLAPVRSYHLDTLSSLNVSSRAKRIEVREIENEIVYKTQPPKSSSSSSGSSSITGGGRAGGGIQRQPLRPINSVHNSHVGTALATKAAEKAEKDKPVKAFAVYADKKPASGPAAPAAANTSQPRQPLQPKRPSEPIEARPSKLARPTTTTTNRSLPRPTTTAVQASQPQQQQQPQQTIALTPSEIEAMVEKKVAELLATRCPATVTTSSSTQQQPTSTDSSSSSTTTTTQATATIPEEVQRRLEALERRIEQEVQARGENDHHSKGLRLLLQARQAKESGDEHAALRFYEQALPFFPGQPKLLGKIARLRAKLGIVAEGGAVVAGVQGSPEKGAASGRGRRMGKKCADDEGEEEYGDGTEADVEDVEEDMAAYSPSKRKKKMADRARSKSRPADVSRSASAAPGTEQDEPTGLPPSPRTQRLLDIVNSRDVAQIRTLHGFGAKRAMDLVRLLEMKGDGEDGKVGSLAELKGLPGMGRTVERAYEGLCAPVEC